ncbi:DUF2505 domain-containing protein [Myxococcota bacterium]|nr:DUF2505 domain-containing protein [Myxococcota bacterium]MBU1896872.1 DUF2505 domain-containing protein [Myxococcota bacterium]
MESSVTLKLSDRIPAPLEVVAEALCGRAYNEAIQRAREDNVSVTYIDLGDGPPRRYEVRLVSYKRKLTGAVDRGATEGSTIHYSYDPQRSALDWRYARQDGDPRVNISGVTRLVAEGGATRVDREVYIDLRLPVIGAGIAKLIVQGFRRGLKRNQATLKEMALARGVGDRGAPGADV